MSRIWGRVEEDKPYAKGQGSRQAQEQGWGRGEHGTPPIISCRIVATLQSTPYSGPKKGQKERCSANLAGPQPRRLYSKDHHEVGDALNTQPVSGPHLWGTLTEHDWKRQPMSHFLGVRCLLSPQEWLASGNPPRARRARPRAHASLAGVLATVTSTAAMADSAGDACAGHGLLCAKGRLLLLGRPLEDMGWLAGEQGPRSVATPREGGPSSRCELGEGGGSAGQCPKNGG